MAAGSAEITRWWGNYQDEVDGAALYRALGSIETDPRVVAIYRRLAVVEDGHAEFWATRLAAAGETPPANASPGWRTRCVIWLARRFGPAVILPSVAAMERAASTKYDSQPDSPGEMALEERSHARVLGALGASSGRGSANPIPAVLIAVSEGLFANLGMAAGLAGAGLSSGVIAAAVLIGMIAGAASKALGRWLSVQSSRELFERQIETEAAELSASPAAEREELALIYQVRGMDEAEARSRAEQAMADPGNALGTMAREEGGIGPEDLAGSPASAVATAFLLFALGAVVPLVPLVLLSGWGAAMAALVAALIALFGIGVALTIFTGSNAVLSGTRQAAIGLGIAAVAYVTGALFSGPAGS
jgi:vacuolar iron transporter family protein